MVLPKPVARSAIPVAMLPSTDDGRCNEHPEDDDPDDVDVVPPADDEEYDYDYDDDDENSALTPLAGPLRCGGNGAGGANANVFADAAVASEAMKMLVRIYLGQLKRYEAEEAIRAAEAQAQSAGGAAAAKQPHVADHRLTMLMASIVSCDRNRWGRCYR